MREGLDKPRGNSVIKAIIIVVLLLMACGCLGIVAAIAIPGFTKFQEKSRQAEDVVREAGRKHQRP